MKDKLLTIKKEYLLLAGVLCFAIICYRFAISNTVEAWKLNNKLEKEVSVSQDLSYQPGYLERKDKNLDKVIGYYKADTSLLRSNMITGIALEAQRANVKLTDVPAQEQLFKTDTYILQQFNFEGDFFALSRFLDRLQLMEHAGVIKMASFKKIANRTSGATDERLVLKVYLQTIP